jgi:hypothetical protein
MIPLIKKITKEVKTQKIALCVGKDNADKIC